MRPDGFFNNKDENNMDEKINPGGNWVVLGPCAIGD